MNNRPTKKGGTPPEKVIVGTPATADLSIAETSVYSEESTNNINNNNAAAIVAAPQQQQNNNEPAMIQRSVLNHQVFVFGVAAAASFGAFLVFSLPFSALVALAMFIASTLMVFYMLYRILLLELQRMMEGRGIGDYLPSSIYQQLTTTSVHEWMMDGSFFLEHRYLLLYFIPGTTQEQLDDYLERLPARHQYILTRPGLGQFLGPDFMRIIMGQARYNDLLLEDAREDEIIQHGASRQLFQEQQGDVDSSNTSLEEEETSEENNDQAPPAILARSTGIQTPAAQQDESEDGPPNIVVPQPISTDPADVPEEELQEEYNTESDILTEAVAAMYSTYSQMVTSAATGYAVQAVNAVSPYVIGGGFTVTLGSLAVGVWGWWAGVYHPSRTEPRFPSSSSLISTAMAGVGTAGAMMLFRGAARSAIQQDRKQQAVPTSDSADGEEKE